MIERIANKYEVISEISRTRISTIYKVKGTNGRFFAAKTTSRGSSGAYGIYENEIKLLQKIQHDNIVRLEDAGEDNINNLFYIITDFIDGNAINEYFKSGITTENNFIELLDITQQLLNALWYIHKSGFIHKDLKPSNIIIDNSGKSYILDFGIGQILDTITTTDYSQTKLYSAPEQQQHGKATEQTDIYQLGITLLEILSSDMFNSFKNENTSKEKLISSIYLPDELDIIGNTLKRVISKMTQNIPENRYQNVKYLEKKVIRLKKQIGVHNTYEICIMQKIASQILEQVCDIDAEYELVDFLNDAFENDTNYVKFDTDSQGRNQFIFANSNYTLKTNVSEDNSHFFAFAFYSEPFESVLKDGTLINDKLKFSIRTPQRNGFNNIEELRALLISESNKREKQKKSKEIDKNFLDKSEQLLETEIELQKKYKFEIQYDSFELRRASDELVLDIRMNSSKILENNLVGNMNEFVNDLTSHSFLSKMEMKLIKTNSKGVIISTLNKIIDDENFYSKNRGLRKRLTDKSLTSQLNSYDKSPRNKRNRLNYRILFNLFPTFLKEKADKIALPKKIGLVCGIYTSRKDEEPIIKGELTSIDTVNLRLTLKFKNLSKDLKIPKRAWLKDYFVIKDIILERQKFALNNLKNNNAIIENLLSKIAKVNLLEPKEQYASISNFYETKLDDNQKIAVSKVLSLKNGEYIAIQGPPGTGKTTVITETILQILRENPRGRILVTSQSNQAVDNVLEKIAEFNDNNSEHQIRIARFFGNDKAQYSKLSAIAQNYTYNNVINTELKQIIDRINDNRSFQGELGSLQEEWKKRVQGGDETLENIILKNINVVFGTLVGIASWKDFRNITFDYVIVDEAGRATLPELAITLNKSQKFALIGDHKQLPPVFEDEIIEEIKGYNKSEIKTSVFEELYVNLEDKRQDYCHFLTNNYRMHSSIANLVSELFYENKIVTPEWLDNERQHGLKSFQLNMYWFTTEKLKKAEDERAGTSWKNKRNPEEIKKLLLSINNDLSISGDTKTVGIISPYLVHSEQLIKTIKPNNEEWSQINIDIATLDAFQGSDRDIIIFDTVRSNSANRLGHITDLKRLNVALSRVKSLLIIVGDANCAYNGRFDDEKPNPYRKLIEIIRKKSDVYGFVKLVENE